VIGFTSILPVGILVFSVVSAWLDRRAIEGGMPAVAYVHRKKKEGGGRNPSVMYKLEWPQGKWIYFDRTLGQLEFDRLHEGDPVTVLTVPGIHPFLYVCVYNRSSLRAK
jgi:hypothetical protein